MLRSETTAFFAWHFILNHWSKMTSHHLLCVLPSIHAAVQLLVELRCEQVGGQGSTIPAWQSASVTSTMLLMQPEQPNRHTVIQTAYILNHAAMQ